MCGLKRVGTIFIIAAFHVSIIYLLDPVDKCWGFEDISFLKYLPAILGFVALLFYIKYFLKRSYPPEFLFILLFVILLMFGTVVTVVGLKNTVDESFLGRLLCVLVFFPSFIMGSDKLERSFFYSWVEPTLFVAAFIIGGLFVLWNVGLRVVDASHIYHEEVFVVATAVGALILRSFRRYVLIAVVFLCCVIFLSHKFTGYLCGILPVYVAYKFFKWKIRYDNISKRMLYRLSIFGFIALLFFVSIFLFMFYREILPTGSPSVRVITYTQRFIMFIESPVWGTIFIGSPIMELSHLRIPSHSDILDILAFGGILSFLLIAYPTLKILHYHMSNLEVVFLNKDNNVLMSLIGVSTFIIAMMFNPVWGQPKLAVIFWSLFGCLLASYVSRGENG